MNIDKDDLLSLADCACAAARKAGVLIASSRPETVQYKAGISSPASQVVTEVDRASEKLILESLTPTLERFDLGLLTEEQPDTGSRLSKDYFWCIDPLDGTLPFIEGRPGFAVSIALVSRDGTPMVGVVYDPTTSTLYRGAHGLGIKRNGQSWSPGAAAPGRDLSVFLDRSFSAGADYERVIGTLETIAADMGLDGVSIQTQAAAVMNACQILEQPLACYFKFPKPDQGGGSLWDFAATACLFREAGAVATDIYGHPLDLNRTDSTFMNHRGVLFATDESLAIRIRALHQT